MKILFVTDQFFDANNGMTISSRRFAAKLRESGHEVRVVSTGTPEETPYAMETYHIPVFDGLVTAQGMTFAHPDPVLLGEALNWADVAHFLMPFRLEHDGMMLARKMGVPYTAAFHCQPENISSSVNLGGSVIVNDGIYYGFNRYFYRFCPYIHCPSAFIAGQLKSHGYKSRLFVISNGIDDAFIGYRRLPKPEKYRGKFLILTTGRNSVEKRQDVIIRALALSRHRGDLALIVAGQGPKRDYLTSLAARLGVNAEFNFYTQGELRDVIAQSDLYVHAADAEIEAMSCMEAFASGRVPVIADSEKSATPQFALDPRSLFAVNNPASLARRIDYWYEHPLQRAAMERRYCELGESYRVEECVRKAEKMFETAIRENT